MIEYEPVLDQEPFYVNEAGTKFWHKPEFDEKLKELNLDINILFSESVVDQEIRWSYVVIDNKGNVMYSTADKDEIYEVLKMTKESLIKKGILKSWLKV